VILEVVVSAAIKQHQKQPPMYLKDTLNLCRQLI